MLNGLKKALGAVTLTVMTSGLVACVTNGRDFRSETAWIKKSQTKRTDVQMMLGEPYSIGNSGGRPTWTYGYYRHRAIGKSMQKELKIYWTPEGTVETFSFDSSFPEDTTLQVTQGKG